MRRRLALDRLPGDLYSGFARDRDDLKAACAALGIIPDDIWMTAYLEVERNDYWLRRRSDIARRAMDKLLKKQLPKYLDALRLRASMPPAVAPAT
jgi:hypothetical protein